jgi:hypothetical protein
VKSSSSLQQVNSSLLFVTPGDLLARGQILKQALSFLEEDITPGHWEGS